MQSSARAIGLTAAPTLLPDGTGLTDRVSDIVGRTELRFRDFVSITHRFRLDKDGLAVRRNEIDATVGSRSTYVLARLSAAQPQHRPGARGSAGPRGSRASAARVAVRALLVGVRLDRDRPHRSQRGPAVARPTASSRCATGSASPMRTIACGLALTWRRDYQDTGDARRGNSFLLTLAFKNLGR